MKQKILFITLFALLGAIKANAYKIHWITFVDTTTPGVTARVDPNSRDILYDRWIRVISAALAPAGYESCKYDYYGSRTSPRNCTEVVQNLKLETSEDIIVFYYIGHGARSPYDKSKYPQMCLATSNDMDWIPLERVHNQLKSKNARLTITIGMCCNSFFDTNSKSYSIFGKNNGSAYITNSQLETISKLFLGCKGDLIASSSTIGETSSAIVDLTGNLAQTDLGYTDYYTYTLIKGLESVPENQNIPLATYFDVVGETVTKLYPMQHPQFTPNLTNASRPSKPVVEEPKVDETKKNKEVSDMDLDELMERCMTYLSNSNNPLEKRVELGRKMKKMFAPSAIVKRLGQDGEVVINSKNAVDYISLISKSRILLNVAYVDLELNSDGLISELRVKEFYRK